jgi:catechol 2,3-dioxygenase-like lactoylglutathione lyase family enzyme
MAQLDHVALTVTDRNRSAEFYARHFGLTERVHDDEHLLIRAVRVPGHRVASAGRLQADATGGSRTRLHPPARVEGRDLSSYSTGSGGGEEIETRTLDFLSMERSVRGEATE